ncbi:MAG: hypothetical protein K0S47_1918 [Herbinix sp.]|jgi:hypothetical protein|nr:hypothetical protein [Herbinix sp.]
MLSKLLKHEFNATARYFLPIYLILLLVSIINRFTFHLDIFEGSLGVISGLLFMTFIIIVIGVIVVTVVASIMRFYKNFLSEEGYLMFTLPVRTHELITSKLLITMVWSIISIVLVLSSLFIVFVTPENYDGFKSGLTEFFNAFHREFGKNTTLFIVELIVLILFATIAWILLIYVSIAVGQLFNRHKLLGSFIAYFAIYTALQIIISLLVAFVGLYIHFDTSEITTVIKYIFPISCVVEIMISILFYGVTNFLFQRKLNLE